MMRRTIRHTATPAHRWTLPLALAILTGHIVLACTAAWNKTVTFDEPSHLFAGYARLRTGDHRLTPEHPPLAQLLAAVPLMALYPNLPDLSDPTSPTGRAWRTGDSFLLGRAWLYTRGNDPERIARLARAPTMLVSALGAFLLFAWLRRTVGDVGALTGLILWCFSPTMLAHARLATTDMLATVAFLAAAIAWTRMLRIITVGTTLAVGGTTAILFVTKFSALILIPAVLLTLAVTLLTNRATLIRVRGRVRRARGLITRLTLFGGVALCTVIITAAAIWAVYGFRYAGSPDRQAHYIRWTTTPDEPIEREWQALTHSSDDKPTTLWRVLPTGMGAAIRGLKNARLLPEAYLYGLAYTLKSAGDRRAYLNGRVRSQGWWTYFPYVLLFKTSPVVLVLVVLGLAGFLWKRRKARRGILRRCDPTLLVLLFALYLATSMASNLNIGQRHILPLYPMLFAVAAGSALWLRASRPRWQAVVWVLLLTGYAITTLRNHPHYLSYFNVLAGGPDNGWKHLSDSNLDWGQDLIYLRRYLDRHPDLLPDGTTPRLAYFGTGDPNRYLQNVAMLPSFVPFKPDVVSAMNPDRTLAPPVPLAPGLYLISATQITGLYLRAGPDWTPAHRDLYNAAGNLLTDAAGISTTDAADTALIRRHQAVIAVLLPPPLRDSVARAPERFVSALPRLLADARRLRYDLHFLALVDHLRRRAPSARVARTIFVYTVTPEDLERCLDLP